MTLKISYKYFLLIQKHPAYLESKKCYIVTISTSRLAVQLLELRYRIPNRSWKLSVFNLKENLDWEIKVDSMHTNV